MADDTTITPHNDGPYQVKGPVRLVLPSGRALTTDAEVWLCRCGHSNDKPFCDGSHKKVAFKAREGDATAHQE